jgi:hypothetical protein
MAQVTLTTAVNNSANVTGLYALGADVRFHWFMIVSNP